MKKQLLTLTLAIAGAAALAACNSNATPSAAPTLGPTCTLPSGTQSALVYPAPGASGVSDGNGEIIIGSTTALPSNWQIFYSDAVSVSQGVQYAQLAPGTSLATATPPFPSPNATPSFSNPQYQQQTSGVAFASGQTVTVYLNDTSSNCTPLELGQFST